METLISINYTEIKIKLDTRKNGEDQRARSQ